MKKRWLAGLTAAALTVSMLVGCSSGSSSGTTETKDTIASTETGAETSASAGDSDTILIGVSASITGSAPTNRLLWMKSMRPAVFSENSWNSMWRMMAELRIQESMQPI